MNSPFIFGKIVSGENFVNRSEEIFRLQNNFKSGNNTILISPRRWGKSSLVKEAVKKLSKTDIRFVFLNIQTIRDEESFLSNFSIEVIKATITKKEELLNASKDFFKKLVPRFSFGIDPQTDLSVSFDWKEALLAKDEILNLPETVAKKKNIKIIVCLDEFQSIKKFKDSENLEQELRSYWMHHEKVAYCIYGSKRHMMLDIFNKENRPFYRFGDLILLNKINREHWVNYIVTQFTNTNKKITEQQANQIAMLANDHSYYIQQLANEVWILTEDEVTNLIIEKAIEDVINTNSLFYQETADNLSNTQINLLWAIFEANDQLFSVNTMKKYKLGTPRNISKNKEMLENKDIIEFYGNNKPSFVDPFFEVWFKKFFYNK
jgi:uncharacterized protein